MEKLSVKTKGNTKYHGKPRVYFTCHPQDFSSTFERICNDIFVTEDCAIYYTQDMTVPFTDEEYSLDLHGMNLFVIAVTGRLLATASRAMDQDFPFARKEHIPVLPIVLEPGLDEIYSREDRFGTLQYLSPSDSGAVGVSYQDKLRIYLRSILADSETLERVRKAFDAYVFLSYRTKDRKYADDLMRRIHDDPACRDIAIWYDEYLVPGEPFVEAIREAMNKSRLFALLVTPNLVNENNYVRRIEYPEAVKSGKKILPAEAVPTNKLLLKAQYRGIPECVDVRKEEEFQKGIIGALKELALQNNNDPDHSFLIGLAYFDGIDVEVDRKRGLELISSAGNAGQPEAMRKLFDIYGEGEGVQTDYGKSAEWGEKLYQHYLKTKGARDPETIRLQLQLVDIYMGAGDYSKALQLNEKVYSTVVQVEGSKSRHALQALSAMAMCYERTGRYKKAMELNDKALELLSSIMGENHPDTLSALSNQSAFMVKYGNNQEALEYTEKAYRKIRDALGDGHGTTVFAKNTLAQAYSQAGHFEKARQLFEELNVENKKTLGDGHPFTLTGMYNLMQLRYSTGDIPGTLEIGEELGSLGKRGFNDNHPIAIQYKSFLALIYAETGNMDKARTTADEAYLLLKEREKKQLSDPNILVSAVSLIETYCYLNDKEKGMDLAISTLNRIDDPSKREDQVAVLAMQAISDAFYMFTDDCRNSLEISEDAYARREMLGENHPTTARIATGLAILYNDMGITDKHLKFAREAYARTLKLVEPDNPVIIVPMLNLSSAYEIEGDYSQALVMAEKAYALSKSALGPETQITVTALKQLQNLQTVINSGKVKVDWNAVEKYRASKDMLSEIDEKPEKKGGIIPSIKVGDTVSLGRYVQDASGKGQKPIEWQVLAVENNRALLLSKQVLDCKEFHQSDSKVSWKNSSLREWLNGTFYKTAFTSLDQKKIMSTDVEFYDFTEGKTVTTSDKVFLLSMKEVYRYTDCPESRRCSPTPYALSRGVPEHKTGYCEWWTRTVYYNTSGESRILPVTRKGSQTGYPMVAGRHTNDKGVGVRPAIWVGDAHLLSRKRNDGIDDAWWSDDLMDLPGFGKSKLAAD